MRFGGGGWRPDNRRNRRRGGGPKRPTEKGADRAFIIALVLFSVAALVVALAMAALIL